MNENPTNGAQPGQNNPAQNSPAQQPPQALTQGQPAQQPEARLQTQNQPDPKAAAGKDTPEDGPFGPVAKYAETGHSGLDMALDFVGRQGLGVDHPAVQSAINGDFGPIKALLAEKGVQGHEAYVALAEKAFQEFDAKKQATQAAVHEMGVAVAGSEEDLQAVLDWASQNADEGEKKVLNLALESGGILAEAVLHYIVNGYRGAEGTSYAPQKTAVKDTAAPAPATSGQPLSPRDYGRAVYDLRAKLGAKTESSKEYAELNRRRALWRG